VILHGRVLTDGRELPPSRVVVEAGRIVALEAGGRADGADLDAGDGWIAPGLIDLQVNGAGGVDLASAADPRAAVERVGATLAAHGVTAFCPTLVSSAPERILTCLPAFAAGGPSLGAHVEGPFISPAYRGVHDSACLRQPDAGEIAGWLAIAAPAIVTLAPELPGALAAIGQLAAAGVVVSLGHSGADAATAAAALAAGARMGTHLFNAMAPLHHRQPGLVGALLAGDATVGLIVDGVHIDRLVVALVVRALGPGRVALVSDAVAPAGAPPGRYPLGGQQVESDGRTVRRADGTIGGSAALLDDCLRNARACLPWLSPAELLEMATGTPARALGLARKGRVAPGCDADLCLLTPDWQVGATVRGGLVVAGR
jgi:N-acetylglucosamine-6-phosphate deacetylase